MPSTSVAVAFGSIMLDLDVSYEVPDSPNERIETFDLHSARCVQVAIRNGVKTADVSLNDRCGAEAWLAERLGELATVFHARTILAACERHRASRQLGQVA